MRHTLFIGILLTCLLSTADAHWKSDYSETQYAAWYSAQKDANGRSCCDVADAHAYYGDYVLNPDGSISIGLHRIRAFMVLKGPNPLGHAVWWYSETDSHELVDYCFAPGDLS